MQSRSGNQPRRLYRRDGWLFGVCGGLAAYFGLSAGGLRLIALILMFCSLGTFLLIYFALVLIMKRAPREWDLQGERIK